MKLTKYEHACFTIEKEGKLLIVDPGTFTTNLGSPENVTAIVITHEHPDHFDMNALGAIIAHNPSAIIYGHSAITKQICNALPNKSVSAGENIHIDPFDIEFFGGEHASIHSSIPVVANLGIMINQVLFYPGDSLTLPEKDVAVLALPVVAPWLKISEAIDYAEAIKANTVFPTHDAIASAQGKALVDRILSKYIEDYGGRYQRVEDAIEI